VKAYVITNAAGKVVGHVRVEESRSKDTPTPGRPAVDPGHEVHEIEFPTELLSIKHAGELHKALEKHLKLSRAVHTESSDT
jgi:hypothetical protein